MSAAGAAPMPLSEWLDAQPDLCRPVMEQIDFMRNRLGHLLSSEPATWRMPVLVLGEHRSRGIRLPVYYIHAPGLEIVARSNFYDWKVSVRSDRPLDGLDGWGLFRRDATWATFCCEGIPKAWVFGSYAQDNRRFTVELGSTYDVYALCLLMRGRRKP